MEELLFLRREKTEELQGVLANMRVAAELRACAFGRQPGHGLQREMDQISHALHVEDRGVAALLQHRPGEPRDHFANLRASAVRQSVRGRGADASGSRARSTPQMAAASASLASNRAGIGIPSTRATILPTCSFSARPVPVTACLMTLGAKLRTGTRAWAAARMATPRAWPRTSAERAFFAWKTSSSATICGRWRSSSRERRTP